MSQLGTEGIDKNSRMHIVTEEREYSCDKILYGIPGRVPHFQFVR